ncbi:hypothetical protein HMPREF9621_00435 [Cutibacterium modestum HL037PA2]|uniref:Uncharacterized protein n=1 Tax=Cutibacterium modestum HL044PA1 TaxID=765109 RepID=A0ABN0C3E0_9ACTN|nr:hypothetical protein HMPREF9621_00435 [Cutibacterium modestum HL037PA2]EFS91710.1 hypothetical protein HMPREF9607_02220 [Cutibacterium modestum HL044PA1]
MWPTGVSGFPIDEFNRQLKTPPTSQLSRLARARCEPGGRAR